MSCLHYRPVARCRVSVDLQNKQSIVGCTYWNTGRGPPVTAKSENRLCVPVAVHDVSPFRDADPHPGDGYSRSMESALNPHSGSMQEAPASACAGYTNRGVVINRGLCIVGLPDLNRYRRNQ